FINRLDEIIVFQTLEMEEMKQIVGLMVKRVAREVETAGYILQANDEAKEVLAKEGFDPQYGARPLRRAIQRLMEDPLAEEFIRNTPVEGST
ncbi:ATP-dependent Clp protease ATP-binding subunit ClpC, partial [Streptococcus pneumoniae]|nr:ATP-dependent Clp protease ATP-binding subunit ClpC [Streptococcus pneumoniae]